MKKRIGSILLVVILAIVLCVSMGTTALAEGTVKMTATISPGSLTGAGAVTMKVEVQNNTDAEIADVVVTYPDGQTSELGAIGAGSSGSAEQSVEISENMLGNPVEVKTDFTDAGGNPKNITVSKTIEKKEATVGASASASVDKSTVDKDGKVKFTFTLKNDGNVTLEKVSLKAPPLNDSKQLGDTFTLKPGEKKIMTWSPKVAESLEVKPVFSYTANGEKGTASADTVSVKVNNAEPSASASASASAESTASLSISAAADNTSVAKGSTVTFQVTIKNSGTDKVKSLKAEDANGNSVKLSATTVEGGGSVTGTLSVPMAATDSVVFEVTGQDSAGQDVAAVSDPVTITVQEVDANSAVALEIEIPTKLAKAGPVDATFTVKNNSGAELTNVKVTEATLGDIETIPTMTDAEQTVKKSIQIDKTTTLTFKVSATLPDGTQVEKETAPVTLTVEAGAGGMGNLLMILLIVVVAIIIVAIVLGVFVHKNKKAGFTAFGKPRNGKNGKPASAARQPSQQQRPPQQRPQQQQRAPQQRAQQQRPPQQRPRNHMSVENIEPPKSQQKPPQKRAPQKPQAKKGGANYSDRNKF